MLLLPLFVIVFADASFDTVAVSAVVAVIATAARISDDDVGAVDDRDCTDEAVPLPIIFDA